MVNIRHILKGIYERYDIPFFDFASKIYEVYRKSCFINFRHYDRQYKEIAKELNKELNKIINFHHDFESELYARSFEKRFAKLCGTKFSLGTSSGTSALQLSLTALGIGKGDGVITAPNSYIATALAISNTGANPVFVDVDEETFNIDVDKVEDAITEHTKAIMPVHLYGQMADMRDVMKLAKKHGLFVVEDACQAFGAEYKGKNAGSFGDANCFSFFTGKNLGGLGNGGAVVTNKSELWKSIQMLRDPESNCNLLRRSFRTPCYLDAIQAAFLTAKIPFIKQWIDLRREKAKLYTELLGKCNIILPSEGKNMRHSYYSYVIRCKQRDKLRNFLFKNHIETQIEYPLSIHLTKTFEYLRYKKESFPVTEKLSKEILSLPISPFITNEEIEKVVKTIKLFYSK